MLVRHDEMLQSTFLSDAIANAMLSFDEYLSTLGRLTAHIDPTASTPEAEAIVAAARSLTDLPLISHQVLAKWVFDNPRDVPVLGLAVGLSQERLKNYLKDRFDTQGWVTLARTNSDELILMLDRDFDLFRMLETQRHKSYSFGDVLVARAGTRVTATQAGKSGRKIEDEIETIAADLELPYEVRTRFIGRDGRTAPCDLVIPNPSEARIVVAAKGFDSTGSKLTDAVREVQEMAETRRPMQYVLAVIDGIGWKSRVSDLRRIYDKWTDGGIDGMYTLATLDRFRDDLEQAARLRGLL